MHSSDSKRVPNRSSTEGNRHKHLHKRTKGSKSEMKASLNDKETSFFPTCNLDLSRQPSFYSCRHGYERVLMEELTRLVGCDESSLSSPYPGLVHLEGRHEIVDPIYALQALPNSHIFTGSSISDLSKRIVEHVTTNLSTEIERGCLVVHGLVPGMLKGQPKPSGQRRITLVKDKVTEQLRKTHAYARRKPSDTQPAKWLLQLLLCTSTTVAASLCPVSTALDMQSHKGKPSYCWPQWQFPAGLPDVDISEVSMPSSAYRKLLEAMKCMGVTDDEQNPVVVAAVDLGASPGGWTAALLHRLGCQRVVAVDRTPLRSDLMSDTRVQFIQGNAFTYQPAEAFDANVPLDRRWMVSDVVAYPDKVCQLLERWCGNKWASYMVVTMKFQGSAVPWEEISVAVEVCQLHGYQCRAKHFFNNKNEVTLMITKAELGEFQK